MANVLTNLPSGTYQSAFVEYDFASGNNYFLKDKFGEFFHFWDKHKVFNHVFIPTGALFEATNKDFGQIEIKIISTPFGGGTIVKIARPKV